MQWNKYRPQRGPTIRGCHKPTWYLSPCDATGVAYRMPGPRPGFSKVRLDRLVQRRTPRRIPKNEWCQENKYGYVGPLMRAQREILLLTLRPTSNYLMHGGKRFPISMQSPPDRPSNVSSFGVDGRSTARSTRPKDLRAPSVASNWMRSKHGLTLWHVISVWNTHYTALRKAPSRTCPSACQFSLLVTSDRHIQYSALPKRKKCGTHQNTI